VLPFSEACERNKNPILEVLREAFALAGEVLEIGSGTGQHAVHFSRHLPHLAWQPTDCVENLPGLAARIALEGGDNLRSPVELEVTQACWPVDRADAVFSANTLHIMSWPEVECLFAGVGRVLASGGTLAVYGPFRYGGRYTAASNEQFDHGLRSRDPASGIRDFEAVDELARAQGLTLLDDRPMPANNQLITWRRDIAAH
jgi:SAM-dependent methyltransferase